jgi:hypothetical protein
MAKSWLLFNPAVALAFKPTVGYAMGFSTWELWSKGTA